VGSTLNTSTLASSPSGQAAGDEALRLVVGRDFRHQAARRPALVVGAGAQALRLRRLVRPLGQHEAVLGEVDGERDGERIRLVVGGWCGLVAGEVEDHHLAQQVRARDFAPLRRAVLAGDLHRGGGAADRGAAEQRPQQRAAADHVGDQRPDLAAREAIAFVAAEAVPGQHHHRRHQHQQPGEHDVDQVVGQLVAADDEGGDLDEGPAGGEIDAQHVRHAPAPEALQPVHRVKSDVNLPCSVADGPCSEEGSESGRGSLDAARAGSVGLAARMVPRVGRR
jgi:hypothetical protein